MENEQMKKILAGMPSFSKVAFHKSELLPEMLGLQDEIVNATFKEKAAGVNFKIHDAERHLIHLNEEQGHAADKELHTFLESSKKLKHLIEAETSGYEGECKAFEALEQLQTENFILKNITLSEENKQSEIDAVVITAKCITLVEVKNTSRDAYIDEKGDYYRISGNDSKWDSNIGNKMAIREKLIKKTLADAGIYHVPIRSVVVFTNPRTEVTCKYKRLKACSLNKLTSIIDGNPMRKALLPGEMELIRETIEKAAEKDVYFFEFDVAQYKRDFAALLAVLEPEEKETAVTKAVEPEPAKAKELAQPTAAATASNKKQDEARKHRAKELLLLRPLLAAGGTFAISLIVNMISPIKIAVVTKDA